jgi:uncharacterized membrane protein YeiH
VSHAVLVLDFISTFAFALVGAKVAALKGMDYAGILFVAAVSALSGGTFRNLALQIQVAWLYQPYLLAAVLLAAIVVIGFSSKPIGKIAIILDSIGLAFSAIAGVNLSLQHNVSVAAAVVLGVLSAVLGGLIRDVLCQTPPVLLHRETNGTATFMGALLFTLLHHFNVSLAINSICAGILVIAIRLLSIKFKINLPKIKRR